MGKKVKLEELREADFQAARDVIFKIMSELTQRPKQEYILPILTAIRNKTNARGLHKGLGAGLHGVLGNGLDVGLHAGLSTALDSGLDAGLDSALYRGLYAGLDDGLDSGLYAGLPHGLTAEIRDGLDDGLNAGLRHELDAALDSALDSALDDGLDSGLRHGLYAGLDSGLDSALRVGLHEGIDRTITDTVNRKIRGKPIYCGVYWAMFLCKYLIAYKWGCKIDLDKLALLYGFVRHTPFVLEINSKIVIAKPTKIKWIELGRTPAPFSFPIYELHADGETAIECAGVKFYYHKNLRLPEYVGKVRIEDWDPRWVLREKNQEVKRCLLQNIPSEKVSEVLDLKTIDTYRSAVSEYELVEAQNNPYPSPYRALRMKCPSTNKPYLIRVKPNVTSARQAVVEFNKGIDPDSFIVEH